VLAGGGSHKDTTPLRAAAFFCAHIYLAMAKKSSGYKSLKNQYDVDADAVSISSLLDVTGAEVIGLGTTKLAVDVIVPLDNKYVQIGNGVYIGFIGGKDNVVVADYMVVNNTLVTSSLSITTSLLLPDGSAAVPSGAFTSDPSTGIYLDAIGSFGIAAAGLTRLVANGLGISVTGNIAVSGTVDGVDVSAFYSDYLTKINQPVLTSSTPIFAGLTITGPIFSGTNAISCGAISCTSVTASGTMSCAGLTTTGSIFAGTNSITGGAFSCSSLTSSGTLSAVGITSTGPITAGTNSLTAGATTVGSLVCSGTLSAAGLTITGPISVGTNSVACGAITCTTVTASGTMSSVGLTTTGPISAGTNTIGGGAATFTSVTSSGTMSCGTNSMTAGAITCRSLTSSGTMSCGTNSMTCGTLESGLILASGAISCGINAISCGPIVANGPITSSGNQITAGPFQCVGATMSSLSVSGASALGGVSCSSLADSGTLSAAGITSTGAVTAGTNTLTAGATTLSTLTLTGAATTLSINAGTNPVTHGALTTTTVTASGTLSAVGITSTGTMSCGTNAFTCGALSSTTITTTGAINAGTNSISGGQLNASSGVVSSGPVSGTVFSGTSAILSGTVSCGAITSSGAFNNGTNSITCGAITSSGVFGNGTNSMTTGILSCSSLTSSGKILAGGTSPALSFGKETIIGTAFSTTLTPSLNFAFSTNSYPSVQLLPYSVDNHTLTLDGYYDGAWKSSSTNSNYQIEKTATYLNFNFSAAVAIGSVIPWAYGFRMDSNGYCSFSKQCYFVSGSAAAPGLSFFNDSKMGMYMIASNDLGFSVNSVKQLELTTTDCKITQKTTTPMIVLSNVSSSDFYEENTWTAVSGDGKNNMTLGVNQCYYTRIGNMVFVNGNITWTSLGSATGNWQISLPFTAAVARFQKAVFNLGMTSGMPNNSKSAYGQTASGSVAYFNLYDVNGSGASAPITCATLSAAGTITFNGTFSI